MRAITANQRNAAVSSPPGMAKQEVFCFHRPIDTLQRCHHAVLFGPAMPDRGVRCSMNIGAIKT